MPTFYPFRSRRRFESGGINQDDTWWVKCEALGKSRTSAHPYMFANEWIAACIAQFLRLPIPPFSLMQKKSKTTAMFCSYSYRGDSTPKDVDPIALCRDHHKVCAGIVLFDILVLNCDRHGGNLKVDNPQKPRDFYIFDHERAMFYIYPGEGINRLETRVDRLGVTDGADSGDEWHCLIEHIWDVADISHWLRRIESIPDWFIDSVCEEVWKIGITQAECTAACKFLKTRRNNLAHLVHDHRDRFIGTKKADWGLVV